MNFKKIYRRSEIMVSKDLLESSDDIINENLPELEAGSIIYTAAFKEAKQKNLDETWETVSNLLTTNVHKNLKLPFQRDKR